LVSSFIAGQRNEPAAANSIAGVALAAAEFVKNHHRVAAPRIVKYRWMPINFGRPSAD
jgi:hypothetical protein